MDQITISPEIREQIIEMLKGCIKEARETVALDEKVLVNEAKAAEILGLARGTLTVWRHEGKGPRYVKLGGAVRYKYSDLLAFINKQSI